MNNIGNLFYIFKFNQTINLMVEKRKNHLKRSVLQGSVWDPTIFILVIIFKYISKIKSKFTRFWGWHSNNWKKYKNTSNIFLKILYLLENKKIFWRSSEVQLNTKKICRTLKNDLIKLFKSDVPEIKLLRLIPGNKYTYKAIKIIEKNV